MDDGSFCSRCGKTFSSGKLRTLSLLIFSRIFSGLDCFRSFGFVCEISYARGSCGDTKGVSFAEFLRRVEGSSSRKKSCFLEERESEVLFAVADALFVAVRNKVCVDSFSLVEF